MAKKSDSFKPTKGMIAEAKRGLEWRKEHNRGGTQVGVSRARDIVNGKALSYKTVKRMKSFFARHEVDKQGNITSKAIMNFEEKNQYNFELVYSMGDNVYTETIVLDVANNTADDGTHIADLDLSTQQGALDAIAVLDSALNTITASQAKLGSTQNRLQHNIDNLTALSSQTEISRGRITDADYAAETSMLSKQQILSQAATSMLAQANQSKQGVLALLQ